jgi:hypothetical protein
MEWSESLAALQSSGLANSAEIIAAVKKQVSTVIGEKNAVSAKLAETETTIAAIVEGTKAEGETIAEKLKDAAAKLTALNATVTAKDAELAALTTKYTALECEKTTLSNKVILDGLAAQMKANPAVLSRLIPDPSKIVTTGDAVTIDGKSWDDWLKLEDIAPFVPALIPTATSTPKSPTLPNLPNGNAASGSGGDGKITSIYDAVRRKPWNPKGSA